MRSVHARTVVYVLSVFVALPTFAQTSPNNEEWEYRLTPYLWLPTIGGDVRYDIPPGSGTGSPTINVGPADWLELLNFALLVGGSAQKGRLSLFGDLVYLSMTSEKDDRVVSIDDTITVPGTRIPIPVSVELNADTRSDLDGVMVTLTAGYVLRQESDGTAVVFAGARYFDVDVSTSWDLTAEITVPGTGIIFPSTGSVSDDTRLWDAVAGVRGEFSMGQGNWSVPYYFDYGAGDSDKTWNAFVGAARKFGWGDLLIAYRHLEYDQGDDTLLQDFSFSGPLVGFRFGF